MAVVVDTSGSVPDADLSRFFAEIHGMWRQGAEVDIIECDAQVQKSYPYRGQLPQTVAGRAGPCSIPHLNGCVLNAWCVMMDAST